MKILKATIATMAYITAIIVLVVPMIIVAMFTEIKDRTKHK